MIIDKSGQYSEEGVTPGPEPRNLLLMVQSFLQRHIVKPWGLRLAKFQLWGNKANDAGLGLSPLFLFLFVIFSVF